MYIQVIGALFKIPVIKIIGVISTYVFFGITMYCAIDVGWPAPSLAIEVVLLLLFVIAFLKLVITIVQETMEKFVMSGFSFSQIKQLFSDMLGTTELGIISSIALLYIHFDALFVLKEEPGQYISDISYLTTMIYFVLCGVFIKLLVQLIELGVGPFSVITLISIFSTLFTNIGVIGIVAAVLQV